MTALSLLRSRLSDAESRAFTAERSSKRKTRLIRELRRDLSEAPADLEAAQSCADVRGNALACAEVNALVDMWLAEGRRRVSRLVDVTISDDDIVAAIARAFLPRLRGEDGHG